MGADIEELLATLLDAMSDFSSRLNTIENAIIQYSALLIRLGAELEEHGFVNLKFKESFDKIVKQYPNDAILLEIRNTIDSLG